MKLLTILYYIGLFAVLFYDIKQNRPSPRDSMLKVLLDTLWLYVLYPISVPFRLVAHYRSHNEA